MKDTNGALTGASASTPIIVLDVDGVLNAVCLNPGPELVVTEIDTYGFSPITWNPSVCRRISELTVTADVQFAWLTTWTTAADTVLAPVVGLPSRIMVLDHHFRDRDPGWWNLRDIQRLHAADPHRLIVWIDDDLDGVDRHDPPTAAWLGAHTSTVLPVAPEMGVGLTHAELDGALQWIRARQQPSPRAVPPMPHIYQA